jgi:hypothetical protein
MPVIDGADEFQGLKRLWTTASIVHFNRVAVNYLGVNSGRVVLAHQDERANKANDHVEDFWFSSPSMREKRLFPYRSQYLSAAVQEPPRFRVILTSDENGAGRVGVSTDQRFSESTIQRFEVASDGSLLSAGLRWSGAGFIR